MFNFTSSLIIPTTYDMLVCARVQQREMLQRVRRIGVEAAEAAVAAEAAAEAAEAAEASETAEAAAEASETAEAGERGQVGLPRSWRVCMCEGRSATRNPRNPRPAAPRTVSPFLRANRVSSCVSLRVHSRPHLSEPKSLDRRCATPHRSRP
jgi:hypothetical protein